MSKILVLAESGFGKSTSLGEIKPLGIEGLDPEKTLIIACSDRGLPFPGWRNKYTKISKGPSGDPIGNYIASNNPDTINKTIDYFLKHRPDIENFVVDDFNFVMQDYYLDHAKEKGYTNFQTIGYDMGTMFKRFDHINKMNKNIIVLAHPEIYEIQGIVYFKMKTVGNMVDQYITPIAKFDIVLMGKEEYDERAQKVEKHFVTGFDGHLKGKAPYGMFEDLYIPNDMGYVLRKAKEYETANS